MQIKTGLIACFKDLRAGHTHFLSFKPPLPPSSPIPKLALSEGMRKAKPRMTPKVPTSSSYIASRPSSTVTSSSSASPPTDSQISSIILALTTRRGPCRTICPSEVPRVLCPSNWRACMPRVRAVAIRLAKEGLIDITQRGQVVTVEKEGDIRGPIRLRIISDGNVCTQSQTSSKCSPAAGPEAVSS